MIQPVVAAIRDALPVPGGVTVDRSGVEPIEYAKDRLYAWPIDENRVEEGGRADDGKFVLGLAITLTSEEQANEEGDPEISNALDAAVDLIAAWVRNHRADGGDPPLWEDLAVIAVHYSGLRGFEYRGHRLELSGNRWITS